METTFDSITTAHVKEFPDTAPTTMERTAPQTVGTPKGPLTAEVPIVTSEAPRFKLVTVDPAAIAAFAREYDPKMSMVNCIAHRESLLHYMVNMERLYGLTMSFPAYGIDPIIFDKEVEERNLEVPELEIRWTDGESRETTEQGSEEDAQAPAESEPAELDRYEKICVDNVLYLSCVTRCLDETYLHKVIAEATESLYTHGRYVFTLVGPRPLVFCGEACGTFIETLKLNSFELSALIAYVTSIDGVVVEHVTYEGHAALEFTRRPKQNNE